MNFITLKELKKMVPVASEFKRVPGLKKILEDGIEVILRKQMENHAEMQSRPQRKADFLLKMKKAVLSVA